MNLQNFIFFIILFSQLSKELEDCYKITKGKSIIDTLTFLVGEKLMCKLLLFSFKSTKTLTTYYSRTAERRRISISKHN